MDATRVRRTRDPTRQAWYARHRQWRFARFLGSPAPSPVPGSGQKLTLPDHEAAQSVHTYEGSRNTDHR